MAQVSAGTDTRGESRRHGWPLTPQFSFQVAAHLTDGRGINLTGEKRNTADRKTASLRRPLPDVQATGKRSPIKILLGFF